MFALLMTTSFTTVLSSFDPAAAQQAPASPAATDATTPGSPKVAGSATDPSGKRAVEDLVVLGQENPTQAALTEQRTGTGVSSIISRTQIEQSPETNLSDILTRLPGLSAYSDISQGQAATGENQYVAIRGLNASYDAYSLNGERIAAPDPTTRAISFDMLSPYGIASVKVDKTVGADQDGDAIGGAIDIRIPTAFDAPQPYVKVTAQGQINQLASDIGVGAGGGNIEIEAARRFGKDDRFGIYLSGYYERKDVAATAISPNAAYHPTEADQADLPLQDATSLSTSWIKNDIFTSDLERYGGSLSFDYRADRQTAYLRVTGGQYNRTEDDNQVSIFGASTGYDAAGHYVSNQAQRAQYFETDDSDQFLTTQKLGGTTDLARWHLDYDVFNSYSVLASPNQVEASLYSPQETSGPLTFHSTDTVAPSVTGPASALAALNNQDTDRFWKTQGRDAQSIADMYGLHADATYKFRNTDLDFIKFGSKISETDRESWEHPYTHDDNNFVYDGPFFGGQEHAYNAAVGPVVGAIPGQQVNVFTYPAGSSRLLSRSFVQGQIVPYKYLNDPGDAGDYTSNDRNANTSTGTERIYAGYVMAGLHLGPVQFLPGFRYEWTDFSGTHWRSNGDDATGEFIGVGQHYGEALPVLNVNWRPTAMSVVRFSVRRSFSRPAFGLINGATTISTDAVTNQITAITEPNPNLKPATATDIDLSAELYNHHDGILSASIYYKDISDFIFTSISNRSNSATLGGNVPTGSFVDDGTEISTPQNGGDASLEGLELDLQQRLFFLPRWMAGFGVEANLTLQHSRARSGIDDHPVTDLPQAPEILYNAGIYYARGGFRADLNFNYTGTQLFTLNSTLPDFYLQPTQRLDFVMKYNLPHGISASLAVQNLLDTPALWETEGKGHEYLAYDSTGNGAYVLTGRTFLFGLGAQF